MTATKSRGPAGGRGGGESRSRSDRRSETRGDGRGNTRGDGRGNTLGDRRGDRRSARPSNARHRASAVEFLATRSARLGGRVLAVGPQIIIAAGIAFFLGMVTFLLFIPLPPANVPVATRILDRNGELVASLYAENRVPVALSDVPEVLRRGIVAVEDERFYRHRGLDAIALGRAIWRNLRAGVIVEGGSTITAQVARTLYLTQETTLSRKIIEALLALKLERAFSKDEILELYLNQIYLGSGTYGVEVAARTYFGKPTRDLTLAESALIAGLPAAPEPFSPYNNLARSVRRRDLVLDLWATKGIITSEQAAEAKAAPVVLASAGPPAPVGTYFTDYVVAQLEEVQNLLPARAIPRGDLLVGGYRIYTSLDVRMQRAAEEAIKSFMPPGTPDASGVRQPQVALVAMDPKTGHILAMAGGRSFPETQLNRAVPPGSERDGMRRQPGSAFKPFLYAAVLAAGYPLTSVQVCEPVDFPAGGGDRYRPTDYGSRPYHYRPLTLREAVRVSDNVVAVRWTAQLGVGPFIRLAQRAGVESRLEANLSLALGSSEVSVLEMTRAYCTFANGGFRVEPLAFLRIEDRYGGRVPGIAERRPIIETALDEPVAYLMNQLLREPFRSGGTAVHLLRYFNRPVAGKTGTTDQQFDAWFIGYTPQIVCAVWVGNDSPSALAGYGGTLAGPVWADFMARAHEGLAVADWERPPGVVEVTVCATTGLLPNPSCPTVTEVYLEGTEPTQHHYDWHSDADRGAGAGRAGEDLESPYPVDEEDLPARDAPVSGPGDESGTGEAAGPGDEPASENEVDPD